MVGHSQGHLHHIWRRLRLGQEFLHPRRPTYSSRACRCAPYAGISATISSLTLVAVHMENYADRDRGSDALDSIRVQCTSSSRLTSKPRGSWQPRRHPSGRIGREGTASSHGCQCREPDAGLWPALPYTDEQLDREAYSVDLPPTSATVLTLDARTLGVGSNSCGPRPLDRYVIWSDPSEFTYLLRVLPIGHQDYSSAGRVAVAGTVQ